MLRLLFAIFSIIFYTLLFILFFNFKFGKALPLSYITITFLMFICSLINDLSLFKYFIIIGEIIIFIITIINKNKIKLVINNLFNYSLFVYVFLFIFLFFILKDRMYVYIDDFYYWGPLVRDSINLNTLYTTESVYKTIGSYPPFLTLLEISFCKFFGRSDFIDGISMLSLSSFSLSLFMHILDKYKLDIKILPKIMITTLIIIGGTLMVYSNEDTELYFLYNTTLIDWTMGFLLAYCMYSAFSASNDIYDSINLGVCCSALILIKQVSLPLCFLALTTYFAMMFIKKEFNKRCLISLLLPIFVYIIWLIKANAYTAGIPFIGSMNVVSETITKTNSVNVDFVIRRFINYFFTKPLGSHPIKLSYFCILLATTIGMVIMYVLKKDKRLIGISMFNIIGGLGYALMMLMSYISVFTGEEQATLACFGRYMQTYSIGTMILLLFMIIDEVKSLKKLLLVFLIICLFIEPNSINTLKRTNIEDNKYYRLKTVFNNFYNYTYKNEKTVILTSTNLTGYTLVESIFYKTKDNFRRYDSYLMDNSANKFVEYLKDAKYLVVIDSNDIFWGNCNQFFQDNLILNESIYVVDFDENEQLFLSRL